jgi:ABC-type lipoprotein release transport system permease subunit
VVAAGVALGLLAALWLARLLNSQLIGVDRFDGPTIVLACALIVAAGLTATWWPARRAAGVDPVTSLNRLD